MAIYIIIFALLILVYFLKEDWAKSTTFLAIFLTFLAVFVGMGDMMGGFDRYIYGQTFDETADAIKYHYPLSDILDMYGSKEFTYAFINMAIGHVTSNRYIFITFITFIIYFLFYQSIKRYVDNYPFALIVFMSLLFFFTFTYLRQILSAMIAWLSIKYIIDRKPWKFLIIMFIAVTIHNSCIVLVPFYFIPIKKYKFNHVALICFLLFVLGLTGLPSAMFGAFGEATETTSRTTKYAEENNSIRIDYIVEALFFLYIIWKKYKSIPEDKIHIVMLNMSIVFCFILLFFTRSSGGGRMGWYYMLGVISTMTYILTQTDTKKGEKNFFLIIMFLLYFRILYMWGSMIVPYKTYLTPGHNKNDKIYEDFEYDYGYDYSKFYRPVIDIK